MQIKSPDIKICVQCKNPYQRRLKESLVKWRYRIYCNPGCVKDFQRDLAVRNAERKKLGQPPLKLRDLNEQHRDPSQRFMPEKVYVDTEGDLASRIEHAVAETERRFSSEEARA